MSLSRPFKGRSSGASSLHASLLQAIDGVMAVALCACQRESVCACVRACVRACACVCACVRVRACVLVCVRVYLGVSASKCLSIVVFQCRDASMEMSQ